MTLLTISEVKRAAQEAQGRAEARFHAQAEAVVQKQTRDGKPFWELTAADAEAKLTLRAWSDSPAFAACAGLAPGAFLEIEGEFSSHPAFGVEARRWACRPLEAEEVERLLGGPDALREKQARDYETIAEAVAAIADPRLGGLCRLTLEEFGERFRRTAAARTYHHARRGGLVEHAAGMIRAARRIAEVYPALNGDLLVAGVLFHDIGKLWENCPEPRGFVMPFDERGELIGHIAIGIEVLNALWRKLLATPEAEAWSGMTPPNEAVRNHLIHLIAAHHGEMEFGSPVFPKTPEAITLHYLDNLDAKLEMMAGGYRNGTALAPRIVERVRPLPANLVVPLEKYVPPAAE
ncbi:MAG: HD domain-containing protein [Chthoniobacteraceae bacterium]|nr:HD domain-containing protein [Chthoniobacteraceae bacterium]